jgi:hypothetical protein
VVAIHASCEQRPIGWAWSEPTINSPLHNGGNDGEPLWQWNVSTLDPLYKRALLLQLDGLDVAAIARGLGLLLGTIKRRRHTASRIMQTSKEQASLLGF